MTKSNWKKGKASGDEIKLIEENLNKSLEDLQELLPERSPAFIERQVAALKEKIRKPNARPNNAPPAVVKNGQRIGSVMTSAASSAMDDMAKINRDEVDNRKQYKDCIVKIYENE